MSEKHFIGVGMMQQWLRNNEPEKLLDELHASGVNFIEMGVFRKELDSHLQWMDMAFSRGLKTSFHAPYFAEYDLSAFEDEPGNGVKALFYSLFAKLADFCENKGFVGRVNLHGASSPSMSHGKLMDITVSFLKWLADETNKNDWPLEYVIETLPLNPDKAKVGEKVADLLKIREKAPSTLRGFCWDLGHYVWNEYFRGFSTPPVAFTRNVRHVHLHDFKNLPENLDHCPLNYGIVPWQEYIRKAAKKPLHVVLELDFRNTQSCGEAKTELFSSIGKMKDFMDAL